jgi:DNA topoisomerase IB
VVTEVAAYLGNTPAVCRSSYIDPRVIDRYNDGSTIAASLGRLGDGADFGQPATHGQIEAAVLRLLRQVPTAAKAARSPKAAEGRSKGARSATTAQPSKRTGQSKSRVRRGKGTTPEAA